MTLTDGAAAVLRLGDKIGGGGEGDIKLVDQRPNHVAKVYHTAPNAERVAKLRAMIATPPALPPGLLAWPTDLVSNGATVVGFLMPLIRDRREIHQFISPVDRHRYLPAADYRMLVAAAANLARAVAAVHAQGHVIGDVNQRCAMMDDRATITLLDTDSFQILIAGRTYRCDVGMVEFQPPELQGTATFAGLERTRNHDAFGLAVLLFELLFLGRHPFSGRPVMGESLGLDSAIKAFQFPWAIDAHQRGVLRPPNTMPLNAVGSGLARYFERAFTEAGAAVGRPTAASWATGLQALAALLKSCAADPGHAFVGAACALCAVEPATGRPLFVSHAAPSQPHVNVDPLPALCRAVQAVPIPSPRSSPPLPLAYAAAVVRTPYPALAVRGWTGRMLQTMGLLGRPTHAREQARRRQVQIGMQAHYGGLVAAWQRHDVRLEFNRCRDTLQSAHDHALRLQEAQQSSLNDAAWQAHLTEFRERQEIAGATIGGIGPVRKLALRNHGVETCNDVTPAQLAGIPGFGPVIVAAMLDWRRSVEARYRRPQAMPKLPPQRDAAIRAEFAAHLDVRLRRLRSGPALLNGIVEAERAMAAVAFQALVQAARAVAQANADE